MLNKKPQTIQGFLTPSKLLSGITKSSKGNASKFQKSPQQNSISKKLQENKANQNSKFNSQNQSLMNTSRDIQKDFKNTSIINSKVRIDLTQQDRRYQSQGLIVTSFLDKNNNINNINNNNSNNNNYNNNHNNSNHNSNIYRYNGEQQVRNVKQWTLEQIKNKRWQSNPRQQASLNQMRYRNQPSMTIKPNYQNQGVTIKSNQLNRSSQNSQQVMTIQCFQLIRKLSSIKQNIQLQISELQVILDNTSKFMDSMDDEFQKIKENVLIYTAKALDNAFYQYKSNMVEWHKYQHFQKKSVDMLKQLALFIYTQQQTLSSQENQQALTINYKEMIGQAQQLQKQIAFYGQFAQEIRRIRQQCVGMRPTITQHRLQQFQKGLAILCAF